MDVLRQMSAVEAESWDRSSIFVSSSDARYAREDNQSMVSKD
jgi:hypothetical protein